MNKTAASPQALPTAPRCLSVDVEDYFHIEAARGVHFADSWNQLPMRVEQNTDWLLEQLAQAGRKATFFMLGHVARRKPHLTARIAAAGHELACHGFMHDRLHRLDADSFRRDVEAASKLIEDQSGQRVQGYRAPTFSLVRETAWAVDVLIDLGFAYDASIFPVWHPQYGLPDAPLSPFFVKGTADGGTLLEVPPLVWKLPMRRVAVAGGGYFRLLPLWFMMRGLGQARRKGRPAVLYFHPWEFDPDLPRMPLTWANRVRTYTGLTRSRHRLAKLLRLPGTWTTMAESLDTFKAMAKRLRPVVLDDRPAATSETAIDPSKPLAA